MAALLFGATIRDAASIAAEQAATEASRCGDPLAPIGSLTASDALYVLRSAVGVATCDLCACDVQGYDGVKAGDALRVLRAAVGVEVALTCPPCSFEPRTASGCVVLPEGSALSLEDLKVTGSRGEADVLANCAFEVPAFEGPSSAFVVDGEGHVVLAGWISPGQAQLSVHSTAEWLLFVAIGGPEMPSVLQSPLIDLLADDEATDALASVVEDALVDDPAALVNGDAGVKAALAAGVQSMVDRAEQAGDGATSVRGILVNPAGPLSGITPLQGGITISLMNEFRRPAYAYLTRVSYKDASQAVIPSPAPLTEFDVPAVAGQKNIQDFLSDAAIIAFGADNGTPRAYTPVTTNPVALPLVENSVSTRYKLVVVGPGDSKGDRDLLTPEQLAKQRSVTTTFILKDLLLGIFLTIVIPNSGVDDLAGYNDFDDLVQDLTTLFAQNVPAIYEKSENGDIKGALEEAWKFAYSSDTFRDLILVFIEHRIANSSFTAMRAAVDNGRKLIGAMDAFDAALTAFDSKLIGLALKQSHMADTWTLDVIPPVIHLNPASSTISIDGQKQLEAVVQDPDPDAVFAYKWSIKSGPGKLQDDVGHHDTSFESSRAIVQFLPDVDAGAATTEVSVEVSQFQGQTKVPLGNAQATVEVTVTELHVPLPCYGHTVGPNGTYQTPQQHKNASLYLLNTYNCRPTTSQPANTFIAATDATVHFPADSQVADSVTFTQTARATIQRHGCIVDANDPSACNGDNVFAKYVNVQTVIDWPATLTATTLSPMSGSAITRVPDQQWAYDGSLNVQLTRSGACGMENRNLGGVPSLSCTYSVAWPGTKPNVETQAAFTFLAHTGYSNVDSTHWLIVCDVSESICDSPDKDIVGVGMAAAVAGLVRGPGS